MLNESELIMTNRALVIPPILHNNIMVPRLKCGVIAATLLRGNSTTEVVDVNQFPQNSHNSALFKYVEVADVNGQIYCIDSRISTSGWIKIINLAEDCSSPNVILMTTDRGLMLKTVRVITPGEPLLMWFEDHMLAMMNIQRLKPENFYMNGRYICHSCHKIFEHPNPLKIHITLKCNQLGKDYLWTTLAREFIPYGRQNNFLEAFVHAIPPMFHFQLLRHHEHLHEQQQQQQQQQQQEQKFSYKPSFSPKIPKPASITSTATSSPILMTNSNLPSPHTSSLPPVPSSQLPSTSSSTNDFISIQQSNPVRKSAFQPYKCLKPAQSSHPVSGLAEHNFMLPPSTPELPVPHNNTDAEQLELFLSNVGKLKNGHYCYFCKKVYTRKYGLKIHIRTHTGYKPLKCKFCARPFGDPSNLNKHMRLHKGDTPYRCHMCDKVLARRRDLERHVKSRHEANGDISDASSDREIDPS